MGAGRVNETANLACTVNGFTSGDWAPERNKTVERQLAEELSRMDGKKFFSFLLWRLPQGKRLENVIRKVASGKEPNNYIQAAGRASALTIEVRKVDAAGEAHHWTIGRREPEAPSSDTEIHWDSFTTTVSRREVFDSAAAAKVFSEYIRTGDVADVNYTKRPTVLG